LSGLEWQTRREVAIVRGRARGWIDLLAYDPRRRILLVVEIKTWIDDLGSIERQLDWYLRESPAIARTFGWRPVRAIGWIFALATADVDEAIRRNREVIDRAFPGRARDLNQLLLGGDSGRTIPRDHLDRPEEPAASVAHPEPCRWAAFARAVSRQR
jgi:hypothetical protein